MLFNSFDFIWIFPIIFIVWWGCEALRRKKEALRPMTNALMLTASYALYIWWQPMAALFLIYITAVTFLFALLARRFQSERKRHAAVIGGTLLALLPLLLFKYYNFANETLSGLLSIIGINPGLPGLNWAVPLGISFLTFQALGYLLDVGSGKVEAERNWWDYMLFIAFFPQIASGPISKATELMPQIKSNRDFSYNTVVSGGRAFLWGLFLKCVIADRLGMIVDATFSHYELHGGGPLAMAAVFYSLQLYTDFAGYSLMAVGVARMLGFQLVMNFRRPYFAVSVSEFWKRWHISLTRWLTEHVYIPLGGSRCGKARNFVNIMVTFLASGLWHGANWTFLAWGGIHGGALIAEKLLNLRECNHSWLRPLRITLTFVFVTIAWIFFYMPTVADAWGVICRIFTNPTMPSIIGNNQSTFLALSGITVLLCVEWFEEYRSGFTLIGNNRLAIRWATYLLLASSIILFGVLDSESFIYVNF